MNTKSKPYGYLFDHITKKTKFRRDCLVLPIGYEVFKVIDKQSSKHDDVIKEVHALCRFMAVITNHMDKPTPRVDIEGLHVLFKWMKLRVECLLSLENDVTHKD